MARRADRAVLVDLGGVLRSDGLPALAKARSPRLSISERLLLDAAFDGSDTITRIERFLR